MKRPKAIVAFELLAVLMLLVGIFSIPTEAIEPLENSQVAFTMFVTLFLMLLLMIFLVISISRRGSAAAMWIYVLMIFAGLVLSVFQIENTWNLTLSVNKQELIGSGLAIVELILLLYAYYSTDWFTTKGGRLVAGAVGHDQSKLSKFERREPTFHNGKNFNNFQRESFQIIAENRQGNDRSHISDEHKLYLIKRFNIHKLDVLDGKVSCENKIFGSIDEALMYAAQSEADQAFSDAVKVSIDKKYGTKNLIKSNIFIFGVLAFIVVVSIMSALSDLETINLKLTMSKILFLSCFVTNVYDDFRKLKLREKAEKRNVILDLGRKANIPLLIFRFMLVAPAFYLYFTANENPFQFSQFRTSDATRNKVSPARTIKPQSQLDFESKVLAISKAKFAAKYASREAEAAIAHSIEFWKSIREMTVVRWKCKYDEVVTWQPNQHYFKHDGFESNAVFAIDCKDADVPLGQNFSDGSFSLNIPVRVLQKPTTVYAGDIITFTGKVGSVLSAGSYVPPNHVPYKILITKITDISFGPR